MKQVPRLLFVLTVLLSRLTSGNNIYYDNIGYIFNDQVECEANIPNKAVAIIVHGWKEDCNRNWAVDLFKNLQKFRGGCIICMDYGHFSLANYPTLRTHFNGIVSELTNKLSILHMDFSFHPNNIYMFGFSFGAHIVLESAKRFTANHKKKIRQIDVCEPTAHGFLIPQPNYRDAAQNVQCIHTSLTFGTPIRECHQDWNMGQCGLWQVAGYEFKKPIRLNADCEGFGKGSHGLCPTFYNIAFSFKFPAVPKPILCTCISQRMATAEYMANFSMGYFDALKYEGRFPDGKQFYALTSEEYPYNGCDC